MVKQKKQSDSQQKKPDKEKPLKTADNIIQNKQSAKDNAKKSIVPCRQKMCGLLHNGCPKCAECGTQPDMVSEGCQTCFNCEYKSGATRDGRDNNQEIKNMLINKIKDKIKNNIETQKQQPKKKILLTADGEMVDENEDVHNHNPIRDSKQNNNPLSGADFEKEFKAEIIRQMAADFLATAKMKQGECSDEGCNGKCKGKDKDKNKLEDEQPKKKVVSYVG
jgi:hypothetical protein